MVSTSASQLMADKTHMLRGLDVVLGQCLASQANSPNAAVGQEISGLQRARAMVQQQWPLPDGVKAQINIGPVAAKHIADWNDDLATSLMTIHSVLLHDGDSLGKLPEAPSD